MPCPSGYMCITYSLEFSSVPTGEIWMVGQFHCYNGKFPITIERIMDQARSLYMLAPQVTFALKYMDDEGNKIPLSTPEDLDTCFTFASRWVPMRIMVDIPAAPGTPLPPYTKPLHKDTCSSCKKAIRGIAFGCADNGCSQGPMCSTCFYDKKVKLHAENHQMIVLPQLNDKESFDWYYAKLAMREMIRFQGVKCSCCKVMHIAGIRWKCCECPDVDVCDTCYRRKLHNPAHHLCPIDEKVEDKDAVAEIAREYLQAVMTGQTRMKGAAGLLLGAPQPGQAAPMGGMPCCGMPGMMPGMPGMPGMMPGAMPGMMPPQQMPGMPGMMPQQQPMMGGMATAAAGPAKVTLQGQQAAANGQMMPCSVTLTTVPMGQMPPPPTAGAIMLQGQGGMVVLSIEGGMMGQQMPQQPMMGQQMPQQPMMGQQMPQQPMMGQQMPQQPMMGQQMPQQQYGMPGQMMQQQMPGQYGMPGQMMPQQH